MDGNDLKALKLEDFLTGVVLGDTEYKNFSDVPDFILKVIQGDVKHQIGILKSKVEKFKLISNFSRGLLFAANTLFAYSILTASPIFAGIGLAPFAGAVATGIYAEKNRTYAGQLKLMETLDCLLASELKRRADEREIFPDIFGEKAEIERVADLLLGDLFFIPNIEKDNDELIQE